MISKNIIKYCKDYTKIENYKEAILSDKVWVCHHRKEIDENMSKEELLENNLYYNRPPEELIFLTRAAHAKLHFSREQTELHKQKRAAKLKGRKVSEITKKKMAEAHLKKRYWAKMNKYNLPINIVYGKYCPEGYVEYNLNPYGFLGLETDEDLFIRVKDDKLFYASGLSPRDFLQSRIGEEDIPETEENTLMLEFAAYLRQNCQ